jgi:hypothetical protein
MGEGTILDKKLYTFCFAPFSILNVDKGLQTNQSSCVEMIYFII